MLLQGTIYSDGKSSTVLSPNNLHEVTGTNHSCTLDQRTGLDDVLEVNQEELDGADALESANTATPEPTQQEDSADSSLLISEETQANKRTQSSYKKTKLGQMKMLISSGCSARRHSKHTSVSIQQHEPRSLIMDNIQKAAGDEDRLQYEQEFNGNDKKKLEGLCKPRFEANCALSKQLSAGSRNVKGMYSTTNESTSGQKPQQSSLPAHDEYKANANDNAAFQSVTLDACNKNRIGDVQTR